VANGQEIDVPADGSKHGRARSGVPRYPAPTAFVMNTIAHSTMGDPWVVGNYDLNPQRTPGGP